MRVCQLASGSKGNSIYIESAAARILIDAGLSARQIDARLAAIGVDGATLDALFVTHEHGDHCRGVGPLARRYNLPVYIHPATMEQLPGLGAVQARFFAVGDEIVCGDIRVCPFSVTHDAAAPVAFVVETDEGRVGVVTDLGVATRLVEERLRSCRVLVIETNHDEVMLRDGPYPWQLKQRIRGRHGHLSNAAGAELLGRLAWHGLEAVFLAHLSETNNRAEIARAEVEQVLRDCPGCTPKVIVGEARQVSQCFVT